MARRDDGQSDIRLTWDHGVDLVRLRQLGGEKGEDGWAELQHVLVGRDVLVSVIPAACCQMIGHVGAMAQALTESRCGPWVSSKTPARQCRPSRSWRPLGLERALLVMA
jgi:hypothetical protein